jgi:serine/threonine protein kinase
VFVATEYFQHGDLGAYLDEHARLIEDDAADVIAQVLEGLTFVHDAGCAHRNIRPEVSLPRPCWTDTDGT